MALCTSQPQRLGINCSPPHRHCAAYTPLEVREHPSPALKVSCQQPIDRHFLEVGIGHQHWPELTVCRGPHGAWG